MFTANGSNPQRHRDGKAVGHARFAEQLDSGLNRDLSNGFNVLAHTLSFLVLNLSHVSSTAAEIIGPDAQR